MPFASSSEPPSQHTNCENANQRQGPGQTASALVVSTLANATLVIPFCIFMQAAAQKPSRSGKTKKNNTDTSERKEEPTMENTQQPGGTAVEVTPEMVEAGFRKLAASGLEGVLEGADRLLVEEIYRSMSAVAPRPTGKRTLGNEAN